MSNETPGRSPYPQDDPAFAVGGYEPAPYIPAYAAPAPRVRFQQKLWKHVLLFAATALTTTIVGAMHYFAFASEFGRHSVGLSWWLLLQGCWYSVPLLLILGAHEFGHYALCRRYRVDATLPYFIPFLIPIGGFQTGTLGAVIRIRERFPTRTVLFDVGIAGPIAGFVVLVPVLR